MGAYEISCWANYSKANKKPFNPLLGETYEIYHPKYKYLAE
jgi:hypothetical protein